MFSSVTQRDFRECREIMPPSIDNMRPHNALWRFEKDFGYDSFTSDRSEKPQFSASKKP